MSSLQVPDIPTSNSSIEVCIYELSSGNIPNSSIGVPLYSPQVTYLSLTGVQKYEQSITGPKPFLQCFLHADSLNSDPDRDPDQGFYDKEINFDPKLPSKLLQRTFRLQEKPPVQQRTLLLGNFYSFFTFFRGQFWPAWIRIECFLYKI
jgi:hypothetical protein